MSLIDLEGNQKLYLEQKPVFILLKAFSDALTSDPGALSDLPMSSSVYLSEKSG